MELSKTIYLGGTSSRILYDWTEVYKVRLQDYFCHDSMAVRDQCYATGNWMAFEQLKKLRDASRFELYVITPEPTRPHSIAELVDAAHRRKDRCLVILMKVVKGNGIDLLMEDHNIHSLQEVVNLVADIGARVFKHPTHILEFLAQEQLE